MSKEDLEERVAEIERRHERRREGKRHISNLTLIVFSFIAGMLGMVFWHAPIPGPWNYVVAVVSVITAGVGVTVAVYDTLDRIESDTDE